MPRIPPLSKQPEVRAQAGEVMRTMMPKPPNWAVIKSNMARAIYDPETTPVKCYELMASPVMWTEKSIAVALGVTHKRFMEWKHEHPELKEAYEQGLAWRETALATQGMNDKIQTPAAWVFTMKNTHNWTDKQEVMNTHTLADQFQKMQERRAEVNWDDESANSSDTVQTAEIVE